MSRPSIDTRRLSSPRIEPLSADVATLPPRQPQPARDVAPEQSGIQTRPIAYPQRIAELEQQLAQANEAMARQRQEFDEDSGNFGQAIARLSHSERALGQTKAKLLSAEDRYAKAEARSAELGARLAELEMRQNSQPNGPDPSAESEREKAEQALERARTALELQSAELLRLKEELEAANELASRAVAQERALRELAESLSRDSSAGTAECARLSESLKAAEEREQAALTREAELVTRCDDLEQERDQALVRALDLETALAERDEKLAELRRELSRSADDRSRLIGVLGALETLGREIAQVGFQARTQAEAHSGASSTEPDPERITLKPDAVSKAPAKSLRSATGPEILIDGVLLDE